MLSRPDVSLVDEPDRDIVVRPRLDLRQANVPKRESREDLEQNARAFLVREHNTRLERPIRPRYDRLTRQHHKPRDVTRVVLDPVREYLQPVDLRGACARYRRGVADVVRGDELRGSGGIVDGLTRDVEAEFGERVLALSESLRVRDNAREELFPHAGESQETVVNRKLNFSDDVETVTEEKIVVPMNRTSERVLHGQNRAIRDPKLNRLKRDFELIARNRLTVRVSFTGGGFGVRAGDALVRDSEIRSMHRSGR